MKFVKRFILVLFVIFFLVIGSVFIAVTFYKKEMATMLTDHLKTSYGLSLHAEDVTVSFLSNWPNTSVQLKNSYLVNELCKNDTLLKAESIALSFNLEKLLKKEFVIKAVVIKGADINLVKNEKGLKNFEFKKQDSLSGSKSGIKFQVDRILIKDTRFCFLNKEFHKKIEIKFIDNTLKLKHYEDGADINLTGDIFVKGLLFRPEKGPLLSNTFATLNLDARACFKRKEIFIHHPSFITIKRQQFNVSAFINLNEQKSLALSIEAHAMNYDTGISLLNYGIKKGLSSINIAKPIDVKALIIAHLGVQEEPIIIAKVACTKNSITVGNSQIPYSDVDFKASIISLDSSLKTGDAQHAKVILKSIKAKVYGFPFTASVVIQDFIKPFITIKANLFINAKQIPFKLGKEFELNGSAEADIRYCGPVHKLNKKEFLEEPMNLNARVKFNNISYRENGKWHTYLINGKALVTNKELTFDHLLLKMDGGTILLKGSVNDFVKYCLDYTNNFKAKLTATTDNFDLTGYVVKKTDTVKTHHQTEKIKAADDESNFEFDVLLAAKSLRIRKVETNNASIDLHYNNKLLTINHLKANTCDGNISAKGTIYDLHKIDASITTENINVNKLFEQFENFGQKAITEKNLQGNIFLNTTIKMDLDEKMEVIGNTIKGQAKLTLKDGHLLNYEPLQKVSDYIFRNRNFQDISFSEIDETFVIDGFKMDIQEMEIASNVLNLFVSGTYHFKEQSNINLLIPWNNLKKRGKNYIPKSSGQTAENSKGLKLNYSGYPNMLKISLGNK
ncbi:MAG: hypothetical protein HY062_01070 [Bacteroidetes bacterium]|nr:hypothetical protein [Bacteroidota bacterium]